MFKIKNITDQKKRILNPETQEWLLLEPSEEVQLKYKPLENSSFEITESNKKEETIKISKEEKSSDNNE